VPNARRQIATISPQSAAVPDFADDGTRCGVERIQARPEFARGEKSATRSARGKRGDCVPVDNSAPRPDREVAGRFVRAHSPKRNGAAARRPAVNFATVEDQ
jgi:hypothetical protein